MKNFNQISRRLKGKMSSNEEEEFDKNMLVDENLAKEFKLQQLEESIIDSAMEAYLLNAVKKNRAQQQKTTKKETKIVPFRSWKWILSAAASLSILVVAYYFFQNNITSSPLVIAQKNYKDYSPNFSGNKSIDSYDNSIYESSNQLSKDSAQNIEKERISLLSNNQEAIKNAIIFFEAKKIKFPETYYYLGHGYWKIEDYKKSVISFEYFIEKSIPNNRLIPQAEFYKSLSLIASGQVEDAKKFIYEIKESHPFQKQFEVLLKKL